MEGIFQECSASPKIERSSQLKVKEVLELTYMSCGRTMWPKPVHPKVQQRPASASVSSLCSRRRFSMWKAWREEKVSASGCGRDEWSVVQDERLRRRTIDASGLSKVSCLSSWQGPTDEKRRVGRLAVLRENRSVKRT